MIRLALKFIFCYFVTYSMQGSKSFELKEKEYGKVILVNAILRHGERSVIHSYPTDPYATYSWPDGKGQLLQVGKERVFQEGEWFKNRYRSLLKAVKSHTNITALSSEDDRTIMSGQCFMASFFTPRSDEKNLKLNLVPVHSNSLSKDNVLKIRTDCAMYNLTSKKFFESKLARNIFDEYEKVGLFHTLQNHSGFKFSRRNVSDCYKKLSATNGALTVQDTNNFTLPSWTKKIFPEPLRSAIIKLYKGALHKLKMKRLTAGPILNLITANMVKKQENKSTQIFHFYFGHDNSLIVIMNALNIFNNIWPPYRSSLVFELRERKREKFVTIFYKNSTTSDPTYLTLPQCKNKIDCPLKTFLNVTKHLIPKDMDLECRVTKK